MHYIVLLIACLPFVAAAQSSEPLRITITAGRLDNTLAEMPAAASVLTEDALHGARQKLGLDEVLAGVPGVFAVNRYNFAQDLRLSIRGFGARANFGIRGVRILIDGIPATTPDGQSSVDDIDLETLERIEIIRGPAGALYGPSAGGVLSLETGHSMAAPYADVSVTSGAYGVRGIRFKSNNTHGNFGYALNVSRLNIDGYRVQSAVVRDLFNGRFDYNLRNGGELTTTVALLDAPLAQDAGGLTAEQARTDPRQAAPLNLRFDTGESVRQQRLGLHSRHPLADGAELRLSGYFVQRDFANRLPFNSIELDRRFGGMGMEYQRETQWSGLFGRLLLGFDLDYQNDERRRRENLDGVAGNIRFNQRERVMNSGIFLAHEQQMTQQVRLDVGLRYDRLRIKADDRFLSDGDDSDAISFTRWSPSIALLVKTGKTTRFYIRTATGFETPTTTELARPDGSGGFNSTLKPATSVNYELGARVMLAPNLNLEVALFQIDVDEQLVPFEIAASPGRFAFENAGRSRNRGLETALSLGEYTGWGLQLAYTYSDFRFIKFTDKNSLALDANNLPGVPAHLLNLEFRYRHSSGIYAAFETRYTGRYYADSLNTVEITSSLNSGLRLSYQHRAGRWQFNIAGGVNNLFGENYNANVRLNATAGRYFEPAPGRHGYVRLKVGRDF
ncbi:TonB-dependent receptor [hydrothermal vent metagenome]|uniref:TonB-dependent receptor n=1 Tax=hydrothermal vent metagenome TaxID=652676 RepID=A0A3B0ZCC0_9ZZZZ